MNVLWGNWQECSSPRGNIVQQWNEYDSSDTPPPKKKQTKKKKPWAEPTKIRYVGFMHFKFNYTVKIEILFVLFEVPKTAIRNLWRTSIWRFLKYHILLCTQGMSAPLGLFPCFIYNFVDFVLFRNFVPLLFMNSLFYMCFFPQADYVENLG